MTKTSQECIPSKAAMFRELQPSCVIPKGWIHVDQAHHIHTTRQVFAPLPRQPTPHSAIMCSPDNGELTHNINFSVSEANAAFSPTKTTANLQRRLSPSPISLCNSSNDTSITTDYVGLSADTIGQLFDGQSDAIEKWLREKAPPDIVRRMHRVTDEVRRMTSPKRTASVTSELFQQWMASSSSSTSPMMVSLNKWWCFIKIQLIVKKIV